MEFDRSKPYNDLPSLPPNIVLETHSILKKTIEAHRSLAELKHISNLLPNQAVLIQTLGLQEAKLSSEIENIVTTNDELYRAYADNSSNATPGTKEVLNYPTALWYGYKSLKEGNRLLTTSLLEEICQILKGNTSGIRKIPGTKLTTASGRIIYTPPDGEIVIREKLNQLEKFIYSEVELDPLIKLALIQYQFEAIHPFHDGNGRTGRILNILFLVSCGLIDLPILYLSKFFLENRIGYYEGLRSVTEEGNWLGWINYILDAVLHTATSTQKRIKNIQNLLEISSKKVKASLPRIYSKDLMEVLFLQPYCKIRFLEEAGIAQRETASIYLKKLEELGLLRKIQMGKEKYYINDAFIELLTR